MSDRIWSKAGMLEDSPGDIEIVLIDWRCGEDGNWLLFEDDKGGYWKAFEIKRN